MMYADDLCIVSLSSAGLQQQMLVCDQYCAMHSITFNVKNQYVYLLDVVRTKLVILLMLFYVVISYVTMCIKLNM